MRALYIILRNLDFNLQNRVKQNLPLVGNVSWYITDMQKRMRV